MTTWGKICRICSSPAEYEVFANIPAYLHATSNEFLHEFWQKPINALIEATTGMKVSQDDGLPSNICALCVSYLKHAASFREQAVCNAMSLTAVKLLRQKSRLSLSDKESLLITTDSLNYAENRQADTNLLMLNNCAPDQDKDKVRKQLLSSSNNFQPAAPPTQANVEQQMRYLNLLFDKDTNAGLRPKHKNTLVAGGGYYGRTGSGGDPYAEEEFQTATSSDENENEGASKKHNIFSYKEKNFEEDDIMDMEELRNAISVNIPESCKERKCRACFRRFMFQESYKEHMDTCIEYQFLTYIEEINRYLDIRRNKAISPHEFIRRMIFCLRKTCEWLKENCPMPDLLLPDLLQNGSGGGGGEHEAKQRHESEGKSSATSSTEHQREKPEKQLLKQQKLKATDLIDLQRNERLLMAETTKPNDFNLESNLSNLFKTPKAPPLLLQHQHSSGGGGTATPISMSNNILYEIERSQSRSSNQQSDLEFGSSCNKTQLKKPIAVLATATTTTANNDYNNATKNPNVSERLTFLQKLQAACPTTPTHQQQEQICPSSVTPLIAVRKDLLVTPVSESSPPPLTPIKHSNLTFSARCNSCNILFEKLASLEVHNAMFHNNNQNNSQPTSMADADAERKRIIALFEDDNLEDI